MSKTKYVVSTTSTFTHKYLVEAESPEEAEAAAKGESFLWEVQKFKGEVVTHTASTPMSREEFRQKYLEQGYA